MRCLYRARMNRLLPAIAVTALLPVFACSTGDQAAAPAPAPATTTAAPSPSIDVLAQQSCKLLGDATGGDGQGNLLVPGTVDHVAEAADASGNTGLRVAGQQLVEKRDAVLDAIVADDGSDTTRKIELATAAIQMKTVCIEAGYDAGPVD